MTIQPGTVTRLASVLNRRGYALPHSTKHRGSLIANVAKSLIEVHVERLVLTFRSEQTGRPFGARTDGDHVSAMGSIWPRIIFMYRRDT